MTIGASEISRMLAARALDLCRELLPAGVREGAEFRCGGLDGSKGKSLGVHIGHGGKAGLFSDFATGESGDALDLVRLVRCNGSSKAALNWAASWLGISRDERRSLAPSSAPRRAAAEPVPESDPDSEARQAKALMLFLAAHERLAGTPVDLYLQARGIHLALLCRQPRALRYHPGLWNSESRRTWPAMVAAVTNAAGETTAVHRTWLAQDANSIWRKAPLQTPKASLGRVAGGTIRLWRGASKKPLAAAPAGETLLLAEGIETALSAAIACPELRVLASVSLGNMQRIELPPAISTIIIASDNDPPDSPADKALRAAAQRFLAEGRTVKIARSPLGDKTDLNDLLVAEE